MYDYGNQFRVILGSTKIGYDPNKDEINRTKHGYSLEMCHGFPWSTNTLHQGRLGSDSCTDLVEAFHMPHGDNSDSQKYRAYYLAFATDKGISVVPRHIDCHQVA